MSTFLYIPIMLHIMCYKWKAGRYLVALFTILFMGILFTFQNNNGGALTDFDAYNSLWNYIVGGGWGPRLEGYEAEIGFMLLMKITTFFSNNIEVFCAFIFALATLFFSIGVFRIKKGLEFGITFLPCIYILFPFIYDLTQLRFVLSYSIVFLGMTFLINKKSYSRIIYAICILVASSIHTSNIIYLGFFLMLNERFTKYIRKIMPILFVIFFVFRSTISELPLIGSLLGGKEQYLIIDKGVSTASALFFIFTIVYYIFIGNYILGQFQKNYPNKLDLRIELIKNINIFMLVITPFLFQTLDIERLFRPMYMLNWLIIFGSLKYFKSHLVRIALVSPIFIFQIIHVFRLDEFIIQMISNAFYNIASI